MIEADFVHSVSVELDVRHCRHPICLLFEEEHPRIDIPINSACRNVHDHNTWESHDQAIGFGDRINVDQGNRGNVDDYSAPVADSQIPIFSGPWVTTIFYLQEICLSILKDGS